MTAPGGPPEEEWFEIPALEVNQPIGTFYICVMPGPELARIASADVRGLSGDETDDFAEYVGIQRPLNISRVKELKAFVRTHDATFPSSILIAIAAADVQRVGNTLRIKKRRNVATILDGQHRLAGFIGNPVDRFDVIVTVFIDITYELQAHIFSTINTKQTKINPSLAADLLAFSSLEMPEKVAHTFARHFHKAPDSPWQGLLKILGRKEEIGSGTITQHAFVSSIVDITYRKTQHNQLRLALQNAQGDRTKLRDSFKFDSQQYPFWPFYVASKDNVALQILNNYFAAMKGRFQDEWASTTHILTKTTGYRAMVLGLRKHIPAGRSRDPPTLSRTYFDEVAERAYQNLEASGRELISAEFGSGEQAVAELLDLWWPDEEV